MKTKRAIRGIAKFLLVALILISIVPHQAGAQSCSVGSETLSLPGEESGIQGQICTSWAYFMPIAIVAVMLSFTIGAFIFIIGTAIKSDRIRNFGIGEIYEAIATALIVGSFLIIAGLLLQTIPASVTGSLGSAGGSTTVVPVTDPYFTATTAISNTVNALQYEYDCVFNGNTQSYIPLGPGGETLQTCPIKAGDVVGTSDNFVFLSDYLSQSLEIGIYNEPIVATSAESLLIGEEFNYYVQYIFPEIQVTVFVIDGLLVLWGLQYLLYFFSFVSPVFIVIGVILRAVFPLRPMGGMLIAVGIGFYIVAPTLISFLYSANINPYAVTTENTLVNLACTGISPPPTCSFFFTISSLFTGLWLQAVFFPILVIAITYTFITQLATFIGASPIMGSRLRTGFI